MARHIRKSLLLGSIAASAILLSGCSPQTADILFTSKDECISSGLPTDVCDAGHSDAKAHHASTAPKYNALAECEALHGPGQCEQNVSTSHGGGSFMPFMMGYLMNSGSTNMDAYQQNRSFTDSGGGSGTSAFRNANGTISSRVGGDSFQINAPTNVKTSTMARGGFGRSSAFSVGG